jgi:catechol 2,3-dioxygenase
VHLQAAYAELRAHDVEIIAAINHGMTKSLYFRDPDGNQLEVYRDGPPEEVAKFIDAAGFGPLLTAVAPGSPSMLAPFRNPRLSDNAQRCSFSIAGDVRLTRP